MNRPLEAAAPASAKATATANSDSLLLVVNFSGGGSRAAAFAYGILDKLQQTRVEWQGRAVSLRDEIDILSGVSGGSITAATQAGGFYSTVTLAIPAYSTSALVAPAQPQTESDIACVPFIRLMFVFCTLCRARRVAASRSMLS